LKEETEKRQQAEEENKKLMQEGEEKDKKIRELNIRLEAKRKNRNMDADSSVLSAAGD